MDTNKPLRWGIIGLGKISQDFILALNFCQRPQMVVAVATSNSVARAEQFCKKMELEPKTKAYGNYDELFKDPEIEIVYIGNMNNAHYECTLRALRAGKHVLCEKPIASNLIQARTMFAEAKNANRFLMEAFWSRFFPAWKELRQIIESKEFGEPKVAEAFFRTILPETHADLSKDGCPILDIGCYTIMFALYVFRGIRVTKVYANGHIDDKGFDTWANITLEFENGGHAICGYNSKYAGSCSASVVFEKGQVTFPETFWCSTKLVKTSNPYDIAEESTSEAFPSPPEQTNKKKLPLEFHYRRSWGLSYETDHAYDCIRNNKMESDVMSHNESLQIMEVLDEVRRQLGIELPSDKTV